MAGNVVEQVGVECASCGQPVIGRYCALCGEKVLDPDALTVRHFIRHTLADELVHLDGKFWTTLRGLFFRPGFLSREHAAGRRRRYIKPVRLLIAAILTYALLTPGGLMPTLFVGPVALSLAPMAVPDTVGVADTVAMVDRFGVLTNRLAVTETSARLSSPAVRESFHTKLQQVAEPLSFTNVVLLAVVLHFFFHRRRPLFVDHAVFSIHLVSFVLISSLALHAVGSLYDVNEWAALAVSYSLGLWHMAYLAIAVRRFYFGDDAASKRPRLYSIATAFLIVVMNAVFVTAIQTLGVAIALKGL
jgi:hypothetical protein